MEIEVGTGDLFEQAGDTAVVFAPQGSRRLTGDTATADQRLGGAIARAQSQGLFTGVAGHTLEFPAPARARVKRIVVVEAGDRIAEVSAAQLRTAAGNLARVLRGMNAGKVLLSAPAAVARALDAEQAARAVTEGFILGLYRFDQHHTREADRPRGAVTGLTVFAATARQRAATERGTRVGRILAEATNLARDLGNQSANLMTPTVIAEEARRLAAAHGLECEVIERSEAESLGMGSYLSVANGSVEPPKFIVLRYQGAARRGNDIALVGKGITFDTGGISLKPGAGMEAMKWDMCGAASVIAAISAIAQLKPNANVIAIAPCTENMPSGSATKPGDVVYAMDGQSIEVVNTDAEGRLVLADGIAYAKSQGAVAVIDVATLTGAMTVALGDVRVGGFSNNDRLWSQLESAGDGAGERYWRMPLDDEYNQLIKSDIADLKNTGGRPAGSITAAKFLQAFAGDTPWVHLDIAGVMNVSADKGEWAKGASGIPVRTLVQLVLNRAG
ncbi:MAG: leucyl aminopeptidase [Chloroflexi bacterium]|nr:leucyl aminopeptidase [Chloroflexota bacterium]MDA1147790.1 leucyl aminopeptidase [Chloroflexota bacterium]PKB56581.1 MAG: leucyl aminopeptidase [SAR202 cluster bacterium Casp-Chloro-G1]